MRPAPAMYSHFGRLDDMSCAGPVYELHTALMLGDDTHQIARLLDVGGEAHLGGGAAGAKHRLLHGGADDVDAW